MMSVPFGAKERTREISGAWASEGVLGEKDLSSLHWEKGYGKVRQQAQRGADMEGTVWQYNVRTELHGVEA